MKVLLLVNPENVSDREAETYRLREAARAIVLDSDKKIALLHVTNENYYKLPGGGIEEGEDHIVALRRECLEEIGCEVDVVTEVGSVVEYRKMYKLKQVSFCFLATVIGEKKSPNFTDDEKTGGFEQVWVPLEEAMRLLQSSDAKSIEGRDYIVPRDIALLVAAKDAITALE